MTTSWTRLAGRLLATSVLLLALGGCESFRQALGLDKSSPDESRVTVFSPLVVPPDFGLRPPGPGGIETTAAPRTSRRAATSVQIGPGGQLITTTAKGPEDASPGELALLRSAGAMAPPENIRLLAGQQEDTLRRLNRLITDVVLFDKKDPEAREPDRLERPQIEKTGLF